MDHARFWWRRFIVIDAAYRGGGICKILMSAAESWASERGYDSVALYSNVSRSGAHSFYQTLGYESVRDLRKLWSSP